MESAAVQTMPYFHPANMTSLTFLDNSSLMAINVPKTPSPLPKSKVLDAADELLSVAEKEFASLESKRSGPLLSSRSSARNANGSISTKKSMTDLKVIPTKSSFISENILQSRLKSNHQVPQNSPSSNKSKEENYYHNNGEKKVAKPKPCSHQRQLKTVSCHSDQSKPNSQRSDISGNESAVMNQLSMFYEQQQLVERNSEKVKENSSTTVIFTSDAKVVSSNNAVIKRDVQTSTESETCFQPRNLQRFTPNSSIISMKTSKPEEDIELETGPQKLLNVQKMPSVNIRPEFIIQQGPKINIVASNSVSYKPKRKNTEYFDVVYPPRSPVLTAENKFLSNDYKTQYVCDRHIFPSGILIPSSQNCVTRDNAEEENCSFDEKKSLLISLIKSLTEKIEKQASKDRKSCCRLVYSLPLLASMVSKTQVNCVSCVDQLYKQLDRLVHLMKEELRSQKDISDDHCCQLDETVQYQIVELELMQDENLTSHPPHPETLRTYKHQDKEERILAPKKSVSFESLASAPEQSKSSKNFTTVEKSGDLRRNTKKHISSMIFDPKPKNHSSLTQEKSKHILYKKNIGGDQKLTNKAYKEQIKNKISSIGNKTNKVFNKASGSDERTVVGQVVKNLMTKSKKSILKTGSVSPKPSTENPKDNKENLNALFEVVDDRETSREFDFWIKERSLKIQKIHNELNKIVEGSTEKYVQAQASMWFERANAADDNASHTGHQEVQLSFNQLIDNSQNVEVKEADHQITDTLSQEVVQDYAEDFEEDVEEFANSNSINSEDSCHQTQAEVENGSSSSGSELIPTDEEGIEESADKIRSVDDKLAAISPAKDESSVNSSQDNKSVQIDNTVSKKVISSSVTKPDIATSPINFESSENRLHNAKLPKPNDEKTLKSSIALSPINWQITNTPTVLSSSAQTEITGSRFLVDNRGEAQVSNPREGNMDLLPPTSKLVPTPMENVLKLSLDATEENELSLQTKSSNQTMNLTVQLPNYPLKTKGNTQILRIEDSSEKEPPVRQIHDLKSNIERNFNSSIPGNEPSSSKHEHDHDVNSPPCIHTFCDKTVKDIIEPTVSAVLKQIHNTEFSSPTCPRYLDEVDNKERTDSFTRSGLTKPNVFLQTKHNFGKKYEDFPQSNFKDSESPKQTVDSSNQTEAEKQNVQVQVAASLAGSESEKGISARKYDNVTGEAGRSYLTMMQPPPPSSLSENVMSSVSCSSTNHSSSGSSSSSTSSSKSKGNMSAQMETLSEGEVVAGRCICKTGDVCTICVPRLDLSFGELKTKRKHNKTETISSINSHSDGSVESHDPRILLNMPLHIEPRPPSFIPTSVAGVENSSSAALGLISQRELEPKEHNKLFSNMNFHSNITSKAHYSASRQFSEVANLVMSELNKEYLKSNMAYSKDQHLLTRPLQSVNKASTSNQGGIHSSTDSEKSARVSCKSKKSLPGGKRKFKSSLVIKSPLETPRIDMVIENSEAESISSYQTSVTSVSVDNLPASLTSHSSGELHHLSEASS